MISFPQTRTFTENNFAALMIVALFVGLAMPVFGRVPDVTPAVILACMMFFSYAKISFEDLKQVKIFTVTGFVLFRFIAFPLGLYWLCLQIFPAYAMTVLLLGLLPGAVMAAALGAILKGNATLGLAGTVISSAIAPFSIPFIFETFGYRMEISALDMFITLSNIIFLPGLVYFALIKLLPRTENLIKRNASFWTVTGFLVFILVVVGRLGGTMLQDPVQALISAAILAGFYASFYVLGWVMFARQNHADRIGYTLVSGCNNIGLGLSLAILYFPLQDQFYVIVSEFLWVFLIGGMQLFLKLKKPS